MLHAEVVVDLPSAEARRSMGPIEWVRSLFGAEFDLRSGKEELTIGALSLVEGILKACQKSGITNAISFLVDKRVVYLDPHDVDDDVRLILEACERTGILERKFKEMHLVLSHRQAGVHVLIDIQIANQVMLGNAEMRAALSGRIEGLRVRPGETARQYADRIRALAKSEEEMEGARHAFEAVADGFADALRTSIVGTKVSVGRADIRLIQPEAPQVARFRKLGFGEHVEEPTYRGLPTYQRAGAYADPFYYHYYDPYYDFTNWILIDAMLHSPYGYAHHVHVVDPRGTELYTADAAPIGAGWGSNAVSFDDSGNVVVDPSIADAHSGGGLFDAFDVGGSSASSSDSDWGSSSDYGDSDAGSSSSCSSGSSCGSSCSSGSSCGSSCGGGSN
ncbi:MAG TPA: hypothetical protein VF881_06940 [Polyangiaceae bacterium]